MRAVERTTKRFIASLEATGLPLKISVDKSCNAFGFSNYVHVRRPDRHGFWKIRISDHAVGMNRALSGREDLYIAAGAKTESWAVWMGQFVRRYTAIRDGRAA